MAIWYDVFVPKTKNVSCDLRLRNGCSGRQVICCKVKVNCQHLAMGTCGRMDV